MCYFSGRLYTTDRRKEAGSYKFRLAVYNVTNSKDTVTLLDTLALEGDEVGEPHVGHQTGQVFIPNRCRGIYVVRYDGRKLVRINTLRCVENAGTLAVASPDTLYVCDLARKAVCLVDVTRDMVTCTLETLAQWEIENLGESYISVLGGTALVVNDERFPKKVFIHRHGVSCVSHEVLPQPQEMWSVSGLSTDNHTSFLLIDSVFHNVYVLDISGNFTHTIPIREERIPLDCIVVEGQLWVLCKDGDIVIMSSQ